MRGVDVTDVIWGNELIGTPINIEKISKVITAINIKLYERSLFEFEISFSFQRILDLQACIKLLGLETAGNQ